MRSTYLVPLECLSLLHVLQTELAEKQLLAVGEFLGIGREIPSVDFIFADLDHLHILYLGDLLVLLLQRAEFVLFFALELDYVSEFVAANKKISLPLSARFDSLICALSSVWF